MKHYNKAFCIYDFTGTLSPDAVTADFVYIRFHGPHKEAYRGAYPDEFLEEWAGKIRSWMKAVNAIYIYFDNTAEGQAAVDAMKMQLLLEQVANPEAPLEGMSQ